MSTVNLSLPADQVSFIDQLVVRYKFANRSEFVRSLLRFIGREPHLLEQAAVFPFVSPKTSSVKTIMSDFQKTNKYSKAFLKDLKTGLKSSSLSHPEHSRGI